MNHDDCNHTIAARPQSPPALLVALAWFAIRHVGYGCRQAVEVVMLWIERGRQRRHLAELSDHMLRDIGVTRADAWAEIGKPFWRP